MWSLHNCHWQGEANLRLGPPVRQFLAEVSPRIPEPISSLSQMFCNMNANAINIGSLYRSLISDCGRTPVDAGSDEESPEVK